MYKVYHIRKSQGIKTSGARVTVVEQVYHIRKSQGIKTLGVILNFRNRVYHIRKSQGIKNTKLSIRIAIISLPHQEVTGNKNSASSV